MIKKILLGLLVLFVVIQVIRPTKNISAGIADADIIHTTYAMPEQVHTILVNKCYDCHSNNTTYPWYYNIQPVAWWMAGHVNEGKEHLNFSDFKNYAERRAIHKIEEIGEVLEDGSMPISSYLIIHGDAKVTQEERDQINTWIKSLNLPAQH